MNKFTRQDIVTLLKIVIAIAIIVVAVKLFLNLLPLIIVVLILWLVYDSLKKNNNLPWGKKKKKNDVAEAKIIKEKKND